MTECRRFPSSAILTTDEGKEVLVVAGGSNLEIAKSLEVSMLKIFYSSLIL
jgi:hypothetical protein